MEVTAKIAFRDPQTGQDYKPGDTVTGMDVERAELLERRGWVSIQWDELRPAVHPIPKVVTPKARKKSEPTPEPEPTDETDGEPA